MNERYFACLDCAEHINAGYRWCQWTLEQPGLVQNGQPVNIDAVLNAAEYWESSAASLKDLLPAVRRFLIAHQDHDLTFGETETYFVWDDRDSPRYFIHWQNAFEPNPEEYTPRDFVDRLGFRQWSEVLEYVKSPDNTPYWWDDWPDDTTSPIAVAKSTFEALVAELEE